MLDTDGECRESDAMTNRHGYILVRARVGIRIRVGVRDRVRIMFRVRVRVIVQGSG